MHGVLGAVVVVLVRVRPGLAPECWFCSGLEVDAGSKALPQGSLGRRRAGGGPLGRRQHGIEAAQPRLLRRRRLMGDVVVEAGHVELDAAADPVEGGLGRGLGGGLVALGLGV